jgi:hypothetical protein
MTPLVDSFKTVVGKVSENLTERLQLVDAKIEGVHYEHGTILEVNETLKAKDKSTANRFKKYPMVCLFTGFEERKTNGIVEYSIDLGIFHHTKKEQRTTDRYESVFKPILYPVYEELIKQLSFSGRFFWPGYMEQPDHTKFDRPFLGIESQNGNIRYIFDDSLDAIEIRGLRLNERIFKC